MSEFGAEVFGIVLGLEVVSFEAPIGDGVDNAMHQLTDAGFTLGRAHPPVKVFARHDIGGGLRPIGRHFHIALLEDDRAFVVADGSGPQLPVDEVVRGDAGLLRITAGQRLIGGLAIG